MKKLIFILIFIPMISFGQSAKDYFERANDSLAAQNPFSAIALYSVAIDLDPTYADAYLNRGIAKGLIDPKLFGPNYADKTSACIDLYKAKELGLKGSLAAKHSQNIIDVLCKDIDLNKN
tara:strand:+ start:611 stop:970 length:360 start_codon:yes stop_codon:yes gene_type:complete